jgi:hypothetical protein
MEVYILSAISIPALFSIDGGCVFWYITYVAKAVTPYTNIRLISQ